MERRLNAPDQLRRELRNRCEMLRAVLPQQHNVRKNISEAGYKCVCLNARSIVNKKKRIKHYGRRYCIDINVKLESKNKKRTGETSTKVTIKI